MSTIFTKIINREIPGHIVYEDDIAIVIMDKFPSITGQTLVISKREVDYVFDLTDAEYQHLFAVANKVAKALDTVFATERTCLVVEGFEVPHVHIKLYPVEKVDDTTSFKSITSTPTEASDEVLAEQANTIKAELK